MPKKGAAHRARQLATLSGIAHTMFTDEKFGSAVEELMNDDSSDACAIDECKGDIEGLLPATGS